MSLTRLRPGELPLGVPLPWPIFGKNGVLLLAAGCVVPSEYAQDLLNAGLYRVRNDSNHPDADLTNRGEKSKRDLPGLVCAVESMQLSFLEVGNKERTVLPVDYLGMVPESSLMVTQPQRAGRLVPLTNGQNVGINMFVGKHVHSFISQVMCSYKFPVPYVHLSYPESFKTSTLRRSKRVELMLLALLTKGEDISLPVSIVDLCSTGTAFLCEYDVGEPGTQIKLSFSLAVGGQSHPLTTSGVIRGIRHIKSKQTFRYGVELTDLTDEQRLTIQAFIYENL
jgi:c-di-GMP-binding flagellar brake protein YcgR